MASTTFTYSPDYGAQMTQKPRVLTAQFGDGYQQRVADGINTAPRTWRLAFNSRTNAEIAPILAFLQARGGVESFNWTDPDGVAGVYLCSEWQRTAARYGVNDLSCTFVQVYGE